MIMESISGQDSVFSDHDGKCSQWLSFADKVKSAIEIQEVVKNVVKEIDAQQSIMKKNGWSRPLPLTYERYDWVRLRSAAGSLREFTAENRTLKLAYHCMFSMLCFY